VLQKSDLIGFVHIRRPKKEDYIEIILGLIKLKRS